MKTLVPSYDYRVIMDILSSLDCARSLSVAIMLRHNDFHAIVSLEFNPMDYNSYQDARDSLQATELLRKHEDLPTNIDKASVAYAKFFEAESTCLTTNTRLQTERMFSAGTFLRVQRKISEVLSCFDVEEMIELAGWGPGSTIFIPGRAATPSNKFKSKLELTAYLFRLQQSCDIFGQSYPLWQPKMQVVEGNKVITVPKNAKTDRIIAVEPSGNLWFQRGIGAMIRNRLRNFGVNLRDQGVNRDLARVGSATGLLATVDFSAASDTISSQLVLDLLPFKWFQVLDALRSPRGVCCDNLIEYEKFSSMGNGFTFELESLIFWAIAKSVVPEDHPLYKSINIFGDDLIIPSEFIDEMSTVFAFCGFSINKTKSFSSSYYRESCGGHYWNGADITPVYLRRYLKGIEIMRFHNRVVELSRRTIGDGFRDKRFQRCITFLASKDNTHHYGTCPIGYGDMGFIRSFDEETPTFCRRYQRGWYSYKSTVPKPKKVKRDDAPFALSKIYSLWKLGNGETSGTIASGNYEAQPRRERYVLKRAYFPDWPSLGPWV